MPGSMLGVINGGNGQAAAAADRYWDAVVRDEPAPGAAIDPAIAATIHHLQHTDDAPLPEAAFAARLERDLLRAPVAIRSLPSSRLEGRERMASDLRIVPRDRAARGRPMAMNVAATAALLAIVVASTLVALWAGTSGERDREPGPAPLILATGITDEKLLLQARFDAIPDGVLSATVSRWVLQPGAEIAMGHPETSGTAPAAYLVETGALSIRPDVPLPVTRAAATVPAPAAEAAWTTLVPGDRFVFPAGATALWRNDGTHPVRVLEATFASRDVRPKPEGVLNYPVISDWPNPKPDHPVVLTVIQVTLHPEGELPAALVPGLTMLKVEAGRLVAIDVDGLGTPRPPVELGQATRFLGSFPPGRVFRGGNDEPVRLLLVTMADANPLETGP